MAFKINLNKYLKIFYFFKIFIIINIRTFCIPFNHSKYLIILYSFTSHYRMTDFSKFFLIYCHFLSIYTPFIHLFYFFDKIIECWSNEIFQIFSHFLFLQHLKFKLIYQLVLYFSLSHIWILAFVWIELKPFSTSFQDSVIFFSEKIRFFFFSRMIFHPPKLRWGLYYTHSFNEQKQKSGKL